MTVDTSPARPTRGEIVEHFNPAWFAAVMGTAVIPLAVSFLPAAIARPISALLIPVSVAMFVAMAIPWTARLVRHRHAVKRDLDHPIAANFFPTMPIALIILALDLLKYPDLFASERTSREIAWWLWIAGAIGIYAMGFVILPRIFRHEGITLSHANFGWYIPPVSKLLIPVAGFELAQAFPDRFEGAFTLSIVSLGVGFFLFLFVGAMVYQRYVLEALPMSRIAATAFIGIAPTAIIAVVLFKLIHLAETREILGIDTELIAGLSKLGILVNWGFAAWAFVMALAVVSGYAARIDLPYALSWWAFTFPSGALAVSSGVAWRVTGFEAIHWFYVFTVVFLLTAWSVVAVRTLKAVRAGTVFRPAH
jgi:C4-dicarboxylate transporter/malic acid transport protein